jgi:hypothetical protein
MSNVVNSLVGKGLEHRDIVQMVSPRAANTRPMSEYLEAGTDYVVGKTMKKSAVPATTIGQIAGAQATAAFNDFDKLRQVAGARIGNVVLQNADAPVDIVPALHEFVSGLESGMNSKITTEGISPVRGNIPKKEIEDYSANINEMANVIRKLHEEPNVFNAQEAKQAINYLTYMPNANGMQKIDKLDILARSVSKEIDNAINNAIPSGEYRDANREYSELKTVEDSYRQLLGKELNIQLERNDILTDTPMAKHAEAFMNRLINSGADSNIKTVAQSLNKKMPEWNLYQDAQYAQIAKKLSGDDRGIGFQNVLKTITPSATLTAAKGAKELFSARIDKLKNAQKIYDMAQRGELDKLPKAQKLALISSYRPSETIDPVALGAAALGGAGGGIAGYNYDENAPLLSRIGSTVGGSLLGAQLGFAATPTGRQEMLRALNIDKNLHSIAGDIEKTTRLDDIATAGAK